MIQTKEEFIRSFLPDKVEHIELTQINMDVTDLGLGDILRNLNEMYPYNTRSRNAIESGETVVGVLCKTKTLTPLQGLFILVASDSLDFELISTNYIVICISEKTISDQEKINATIYKLTEYLAKNFHDTMPSLADFYRKFIYDPEEDLELEDEYSPDPD